MPLAALPLKRRVALLAGGLGLCLSAAFAVLAWFVAEDYEHLLVTAVLEAEASGVRRSLGTGETPRLPDTSALRGWLYPPTEAPPPGLPADWAQMPPGVHEHLRGAPDGLHLAVFELDGQRLVYAMDLDPIEALERYLAGLSLLIVLVGGGGSALLAQWLAGRALKPVTTLAAAVDALPPHPQPTALAQNLPDDGLRSLALAIDGYQRRLLEASAAERAFFADASHELRSPVASLRGAAEVLLDDPETSARQRQRLARIDRATEDLGQLLDGLLLSARGAPPLAAPVDLAALLQEVCGSLAARAQARGVVLNLQPPAAALQPALPVHWLRTALLNLLRSLIDSHGMRALQVQAVADGVEVRIEGDLPAAGERSDRGFPLRLVERLCHALGGALEIGAAGVHLRLPAES
jgi:signal transduction histidine kinase